MKIIKRSGEESHFESEKIIQWMDWAADGMFDATEAIGRVLSKVEDGMSTREIHELQIKEFSSLGTESGLVAAGRIYMGSIRKEMFGKTMKIPHLAEIYATQVAAGRWKFKRKYSKKELDALNDHLGHEEDMHKPISQLRQVVDRYAVKDLATGAVYETPAIAAMRAMMGAMAGMPKSRRLGDVLAAFKYVRDGWINIPSPFYAFLGTPTQQGASCCVTTAADTAVSIAVQAYIAEIMTVAGAGIGAHMMVRSKGDSVRGGAIVHQGKVPYYRHGQTAVLANKQGSRGGAMTMAFSCLDPELFDILRLKSIKTPLEVKVKDIDYAFGYNNSFVRAVSKGADWCLVSYKDAPLLHHLMYSPTTEEFDEEFARVIADPAIKKKILPAREVLKAFLTEAMETGRYYEYNTTWMNWHTPFKDTIHSSNLCLEIALPTRPFVRMQSLYKKYSEGEIALCSLAAIAAWRIPKEEYENVAYYALLIIDNVIEDIDYPFPSLRRTAVARRSVGVGITDFARGMAESHLHWDSEEGMQYAFTLADRHSYSLHKAAIRLTKERGVCEWTNRTKYPEGWLPIDTSNREVENKWGASSECAWEEVRQEIVKLGGLRFSVLEAHMPCESSSVASYHTNSILPVRKLRVIKPSGANINVFIAPGGDALQKWYELAYDIPTSVLTKYYAIFQARTGQAISADIYTKHAEAGRRKVSLKSLMNEWIERQQLGMKSRYYWNNSTETQVTEKEASCDNCSL